MNKYFPHMYDCPETGQSAAGISYSTIPFVVLPFTLTLLTIGSEGHAVYMGIEYVYQAINFAAMFFIYRTYLQDSWLNVSIHPKKVLTVSLCVAGKRILAYIAVAAMLAAPRIVTYFTVWGGWWEIELYLGQLPIHWLACWTYQKTDTVWAPIFTHAMANAFCCIMLCGLQFAGIIA